MFPHGLLRTLSHPSVPPGQESDPRNPHLFKVIDPVSITPIVASMAIVTRAHLDPISDLRRLVRRDLPIVQKNG